MNQSDSIAHIAPAWCAALHEVDTVTKDSISHYGNYASLGQVLATVKPVLKKHGLSLQQYHNTSDTGSVLTITRIWHGESGEWLEDGGLRMPAPNDPQKVGGSITYGRRYSLSTFFSLSTSDDDGQEASAAMKPQPPQRETRQAQQVEQIEDSASALYAALLIHKGTPVADSMKRWAKEQEYSMTVDDFRAHPDWQELVAARLADTVDADS